MKFYKTFTTKDTSVSISDSIRLVSKPFIYSLFKLLYYLNLNKMIMKSLKENLILTLQQVNYVGFLYTFTFQYTRKHIRLMKFYKTFTTKDTIVSINDSIRLVSKPFIYFLFKLLYYLNSFYLLIFQLLNYEVDRSFQIFRKSLMIPFASFIALL